MSKQVKRDAWLKKIKEFGSRITIFGGSLLYITLYKICILTLWYLSSFGKIQISLFTSGDQSLMRPVHISLEIVGAYPDDKVMVYLNDVIFYDILLITHHNLLPTRMNRVHQGSLGHLKEEELWSHLLELNLDIIMIVRINDVMRSFSMRMACCHWSCSANSGTFCCSSSHLRTRYRRFLWGDCGFCRKSHRRRPSSSPWCCEIMMLHVIVDIGLNVVLVVLLSKLVDDHETSLNKKIVTNYLNVMVWLSLGSYLSDLRLTKSCFWNFRTQGTSCGCLDFYWLYHSGICTYMDLCWP